jgi:NAD(P)-dependent dehydrogenase (short-subunit alcohol dehydrogenase family)
MRVLLVGGGCRGLALTRELAAEGHAVRAVTRTESGRAAIEAAGAECWIGDPDVIGTLRYALDNVTILVWALATASGEPADVAALHGSRLAMMLERTVDTMVRGVVYEARGSVDPGALAAGAAEVRRANATNEVPYALLDADPAHPVAWVAAVRRAIDELLVPGRVPTAG